MKNKTLLLLFSMLTILGTVRSKAQGCFPDPNFASEGYGAYPAGPMLTDCSGSNSYKTIISVTDTVMPNPINPSQPISTYIDAMRIVGDTGLPAGLIIETDVLSSATAQSPYGTWVNGGSVGQGLIAAIGCLNITGDPTDWAAASSGGPNNDGVYPVTLSIDLRIAGTVPDISFLIANGSWASETGGLVGPITLELELHVNDTDCNGTLFAFPEVVADNDTTQNCDGEVNVEVYNGVPPYSFTFSTGATGSSSLTGLCPGLYSVSITDANGASAITDFVIGSSQNVYSNVGSGGVWPPAGADTLFSSYATCDIDYNLPLDSFEIVSAVTSGPDTCLVTWVVWQQGAPYTVTSIYPFLGSNPTVFSLMLWCENGRSTLGEFEIYEFMDLSVGIQEHASSINAEVFPNPSSGLFNLRLETTKWAAVRISDLSGRLIANRQFNGSTLYSFDLQGAPAGVYLMEIETEQGRTFKRLVKN